MLYNLNLCLSTSYSLKKIQIRNASDNSPLKIFQSGSGQKANTNITWTHLQSIRNFADHKISEFYVYSEIHSEKAGEEDFFPGHGMYFHLLSRIDLALLLIFWDFILLGYQVGLGCFQFDSFKYIFISDLDVEQFRTSWWYFDLLMALYSEFKARGVSWGKL